MARNWKKMSKEEEDKKRQETIDKAVETMNKGIYEYLDSDRFKTLLDTMSKFHDYSMNNTLLILGQNPRATHLAGYNKWQQDFNRQVKRGEKGLMIWMPVEIKVKEKQYVLDENGNRILGDDGKFKKEEVVVKKHTFKIGYTFDVSQTEQIEGKEVVELSPVKELEGDVKDYDNDKATQLIFCDSSTPHKNEKENDEETGYVFSNVYDDLKLKFVELGIPENEIAFIHDYDTELKKQNLFEKMNKGEMRVLIGSTPKLGAGTNIQERMIAIHHVDVPWRASDIEQQNGRAFRQGNMYNEIYEFRYVTKKSFDAYSWQMVETKSSYVTQLLEGTGDTREFEEDTQNSFSYAEVKAIASGNPIIKEKFEVDNEVKRLETMRRSWQKKKLQAQDDVALLPDRIETEKKYRTILAEECEYFKDEIEANNLRDTEHFTFYDVKGNEYHDLKEAWDAIQECTKGYKLSDFKENQFVGRFMKADVLIGLGLAGEGIVIKLKTPLRTINVDSVNPVGRVNFNRMYKRINDIRYSLNKTIETIQNYEGNLKIAKEMVNKPF